MGSWERPPEQTRAEGFASTGGCNSLPFPAEQFPRLLGRFLHQEAHLRMRRFEVGSNPVPLQFFRCCWPYRSHDCAAKPESHRLLQFHLRGNLEEVRDLHARGEQHNVNLSQIAAEMKLQEPMRLGLGRAI